MCRYGAGWSGVGWGRMGWDRVRVWCDVVWCCVVWCGVVWYSAMWHVTSRRGAVWHGLVLTLPSLAAVFSHAWISCPGSASSSTLWMLVFISSANFPASSEFTCSAAPFALRSCAPEGLGCLDETASSEYAFAAAMPPTATILR